jgi:D-alanine transaminase
MPAFAYVNGRYAPIRDARVAVEDRGFQFADSIYEVVAIVGGRRIDWEKHCWRLRRNAAALFLGGLPTDAVLGQIAARLTALSRYRDALLYVQLSRGPARRDHGVPAAPQPTLVLTIRRFDPAARLAQAQGGVAAITLPDQRWGRCDIKATGLLFAVMAKEEARRAGAYEALLVRDGVVTEGSSTNAWLVDAAGGLVTHPLSAHILPGIARDTLLGLARTAGIAVAERPFTPAEAAGARELFLTSTSSFVMPVVRLDGAAVGSGAPGPVTRRLAALYAESLGIAAG